jgi:hypothetical protein
MLQNGQWRSVAVQFVSKPGIYHGAGIELRTAAGIRVQDAVQIYMASRARKWL